MLILWRTICWQDRSTASMISYRLPVMQCRWRYSRETVANDRAVTNDTSGGLAERENYRAYHPLLSPASIDYNLYFKTSEMHLSRRQFLLFINFFKCIQLYVLLFNFLPQSINFITNKQNKKIGPSPSFVWESAVHFFSKKNFRLLDFISWSLIRKKNCVSNFHFHRGTYQIFPMIFHPHALLFAWSSHKPRFLVLWHYIDYRFSSILENNKNYAVCIYVIECLNCWVTFH